MSTDHESLYIVAPTREHLAGYVDALQRGWSPDNVRGDEAAREQLERIAADPDAFLATQDDREARAGPVRLPDGSEVTRLPGFHRWLWDGEFCGTIAIRWQPGTEELPPYCLGHVGYAVVPWKRRRGYATKALALLLQEAGTLGLRYVEITTDVDNLASQRVIEANDGRLVERFIKPAQYGGSAALRYRIYFR
jgi:predicted acetyltransferase